MTSSTAASGITCNVATSKAEVSGNDALMFQTASGRPLPVSEESMKKAQSHFDLPVPTSWTPDAASGNTCNVATSKAEVSGNDALMFQTASGRPLPVSEENMKKAQSHFDLPVPTSWTPDAASGNTCNVATSKAEVSGNDALMFQTASGRPLPVSEENMKKAQSHFDLPVPTSWTPDAASGNTCNVATSKAEVSGNDALMFQTASGRPLPVSEESMKKAQSHFDLPVPTSWTPDAASGNTCNVATSTAEVSGNDALMFQTASGRPLPVSEESMKKGAVTF